MVEVSSLLRATFLGLQLGMTLVLVTAGLTLIFGMMDVVNVAHGSLFALGAYFGLALVNAVGSFWLAVVVAPLLVGVVGLLIEVFTVRPLYGRDPLYHILLTFGLLIVLEEVTLLVWGGQVKSLDAPAVFDASLSVGAVAYPSYRVFLLAVSTVVVVLLWLALTRTDFGILLRASAHDAEMVGALGVDVSRVFTGVFVLGAALAGLAGVLLGVQRGFQPATGVRIIIEAFAIVVIGGLGSFRGAVAGALLVGLLQAYVSLYAVPLAELSTFVLMTAVLLVRPSGLFGRAEGA